MKLTLTGRCKTCHERHPPACMCPLFEVRVTGQSWFYIYINELEAEVERLRAIIAKET